MTTTVTVKTSQHAASVTGLNPVNDEEIFKNVVPAGSEQQFYCHDGCAIGVAEISNAQAPAPVDDAA